MLNSVSEITDSDFNNPQRDVFLPPLPKNVLAAIKSDAKPVLIKRNILEKNRDKHKELTPEDNRRILSSALYNPDLVGQTQPKQREHYWVTVKLDDKNAMVVIDLFPTKENIEVVGWHYVDQKGIKKLERQVEREGGQFLILSPAKSGLAAALSALPSDMLSASKDTTFSSQSQVFEEKNAKKSTITPMLQQILHQTGAEEIKANHQKINKL